MATLNYLTRVAQVDALKLDNEIIEIFKRQISELLQYLPVSQVFLINVKEHQFFKFLSKILLTGRTSN